VGVGVVGFGGGVWRFGRGGLGGEGVQWAFVGKGGVGVRGMHKAGGAEAGRRGSRARRRLTFALVISGLYGSGSRLQLDEGCTASSCS